MGSISDRGVYRVKDDALVAGRDGVAVEEPLELRVAGEPVYLTMRTPGNDKELMAGLLIAEGVIAPAEAGLVSVADEEGVVVLDMAPEAFRAAWPERSAAYASSACGVCGRASVDSLASELEPIGASPIHPIKMLAALPDKLRSLQPVFEESGATHASGLFDSDGGVLCVREDVGRHNAVDKVVGYAAAADLLPATDCVLVVSGRVSFEIAHKAVAARIPVIVAVSAPTSLAIDVAERFRVTICGFARRGRFNVYSHPARIDIG